MKCKDCKFFVQKDCRRFPPVPMILSISVLSTISAQWPSVKEDDWCGEHAYRMKEPARQTAFRGDR